MASKLSIILTLAILFEVQANDIHLGFTSPSSRKIYSEIKEANAAVLWTRYEDLIINAVGTEVISAIYVTDLSDNKDCIAIIESGGVGMKSVTIGLKAPSIVRGYKFEVEVFADDANARYYSKGVNYPSSTNYEVKGGYSAPYYDNGQYSRKW